MGKGLLFLDIAETLIAEGEKSRQEIESVGSPAAGGLVEALLIRKEMGAEGLGGKTYFEIAEQKRKEYHIGLYNSTPFY